MSIQPFKNCFGLSVKDNVEKVFFFFFFFFLMYSQLHETHQKLSSSIKLYKYEVYLPYWEI